LNTTPKVPLPTTPPMSMQLRLRSALLGDFEEEPLISVRVISQS
jgi:hypothetical protein